MTVTFVTNSDRMVGTARSDGTTSIDKPMAPITVNDSTLQLANETGMIDAMNQMNQEASQEESSLPEETEGDQEVPDAPVQRKERKKDIRLNDLANKLKEVAEERDAYAARAREEYERRQALEAQGLENTVEKLQREKADVDNQLDKISRLMISAQQNNDPQSVVKANRLLSQYALKQTITEQQLEVARNTYLESQIESQAEQQAPQYSQEQQYWLSQVAQPRDLQSDDFRDWIEERPAYNAFHPEYNKSLASVMATAKDEYTNYLYVHGRQNEIGTAEFYNDIDSVVSNIYQQRYGSPQGQSQDYYNQYTGQPEGNQTMANTLGSAFVAPVSRQGVHGQDSRLPPLTPLEMQIAESCDMYEGHGAPGSKFGRPLERHEKHKMYQINKAKMMGSR